MSVASGCFRDRHCPGLLWNSEYPVAIGIPPIEPQKRDVEISDLDRLRLRQAVHTYDPATVLCLHDSPFLFARDRIGVELAQVAQHIRIARVFHQVLYGMRGA